MEKRTLHSPDLTERNIEKIAELFPSVITESRDAEGNVNLAVDFDLLRQELSDHIVEGPQERYQLDWPGKRAAAFVANAPIAKTLRPVREESVDFNTTQNLFIEGDNLEVLKLLQESYLGKVKSIYIDPPYNTGSDQFVYSDDFAQDTKGYLRDSGQVDETGNRMQSNSESNGRFHSDWLSMMYPRLKIARTLLTEDGVMFISIDENEVANLVRMCEEIFGRRNVLGALPVVMNLKGNQDAFGFAETHEFLVACVRDRSRAAINEFPVDEESLLTEWREDEYGLFKEADNLRATGVNAPRSKRPNLWYPIFVDPATETAYVTESDEPESSSHSPVWPINPEGEELSWYWSKAKFQQEQHNLILKNTKNGYQFYKKQRPGIGELPTKKPKSFLFKPSYSTSTATKQMRDLMDGKYFSAPKPVPFIEDLLQLSTDPNSIVMDFFAGSGTLAHAVLALNARDGGNRRFIAVQIAEEFPQESEARRAGYKTIAEFARNRIVRAAKLNESGSTHAEWNGDVGFRSLKVSSTNLAQVFQSPDATDQLELVGLEGSIKHDRTSEDLLFQVLLDWGLELTLPIATVKLENQEVFSVDGGALIACFDEPVGSDLLRAVAERGPLRAVFRDSAFESDAARLNAEQIFQELSPATELRVI